MCKKCNTCLSVCFQVNKNKAIVSSYLFFSFQLFIFRDTFQKRISEIFVVYFTAEMADAVADCEVTYMQHHVVTYYLVEYSTRYLNGGSFVLLRSLKGPKSGCMQTESHRLDVPFNFNGTSFANSSLGYPLCVIR